MDEEKLYRHESYGLASFSRITGDPGRLFGSSLPHQYTFIRLSIRRAERVHRLSHDWYHAVGPDLVEVDLSATQFAELLTTMNRGAGVPCTVRRVDGKQVEGPPEEMTEAEEIRTNFASEAGRLAMEVERKAAEVKALLEKKSLSKADREQIMAVFDRTVMEIRANMPFVLDSFEEAAEKVASAAKAEADAFLTHAISMAGLKALSVPEQPEPPPALDEGDK